jgi:hypothetical protein
MLSYEEYRGNAGAGRTASALSHPDPAGGAGRRHRAPGRAAGALGALAPAGAPRKRHGSGSARGAARVEDGR